MHLRKYKTVVIQYNTVLLLLIIKYRFIENFDDTGTNTLTDWALCSLKFYDKNIVTEIEPTIL